MYANAKSEMNVRSEYRVCKKCRKRKHIKENFPGEGEMCNRCIVYQQNAEYKSPQDQLLEDHNGE